MSFPAFVSWCPVFRLQEKFITNTAGAGDKLVLLCRDKKLLCDTLERQDAKTGHNLVTMPCKSLFHNASRGFDSPTSNMILTNSAF